MYGHLSTTPKSTPPCLRLVRAPGARRIPAAPRATRQQGRRTRPPRPPPAAATATASSPRTRPHTPVGWARGSRVVAPVPYPLRNGEGGGPERKWLRRPALGNPIDPKVWGRPADQPQMDPEWTPDRPRWTPDRPQTDPNPTRDRPQIAPQITPNSSPNRPQVGPRSTQINRGPLSNRPQLAPGSTRIRPKSTPTLHRPQVDHGLTPTPPQVDPNRRQSSPDRHKSSPTPP